MDYFGWNDKLARYFFNEDMAGREVLLYSNKDTIQNFGNLNDFVEKVKSGPPGVTHQGLCQKALDAQRQWENRDDYPPYIAYLVLFVLAEDTEGEFSPLAYYPRLWTLLGEPENKTRPPSFDKVWELWADLEAWSKFDKQEELGWFEFRIRGGHDHVGVPLSQSLLSFSERRDLPVIFYQAELDPTNVPPMESMRAVLIRHGRKEHRLSRRTLQVLEGEDSDFQRALLEFVVVELSSWDGTSPELLTPEEEKQRLVRSGLRICIKIDEVLTKVQSYFRFKSNRPFPDNGLNFRLSDAVVLTCDQSVSDWSTRLKNDGAVLDASSVDWSSGLKMLDEENNWEAALRGGKVRLFVSGTAEELPDWIEVQRLERRKEFLVAVQSELASRILEWGRGACEVFQEKAFIGLPKGWTLFYGKNANESCPGIEVLTLSKMLRLAFRGGIRISTGTTFLRKALPDVVLENASGDEKLFVNERALSLNTTFQVWKLPDSGSSDKLKIEVRDTGNICLHTRTIKIRDPEIYPFDAVPKRGFDGKRTEDSPYVVGPVLHGGQSGQHGEFPLLLPFHLARRIIFIGSRPGQIVYWPQEDVAPDWQAVWAIAKTGKNVWTVHFCGNSESLDTVHLPGDSVPGSGRIKDWKSAVRHNSKATSSIPALQKLWKKYLDRARNV